MGQTICCTLDKVYLRCLNFIEMEIAGRIWKSELDLCRQINAKHKIWEAIHFKVVVKNLDHSNVMRWWDLPFRGWRTEEQGSLGACLTVGSKLFARAMTWADFWLLSPESTPYHSPSRTEKSDMRWAELAHVCCFFWKPRAVLSDHRRTRGHGILSFLILHQRNFRRCCISSRVWVPRTWSGSGKR